MLDFSNMEPIDVAHEIATAKYKCATSPIVKAVTGNEISELDTFSPDDIEEIAKYLLLYVEYQRKALEDDK